MSIKLAESKSGLIMCDPPEGYRYGFPKAVDKTSLEDDEAYTVILRDAGYPEKLIPLALKYSRFWEFSLDK